MEVLECPAKLQRSVELAGRADSDDVRLVLEQLLDGPVGILCDRRSPFPSLKGAVELSLERPAEFLLIGNRAVR